MAAYFNPLRRALFRGLALFLILLVLLVYTKSISLAQGTVVEMGSAQVTQGAEVVVSITVRNVTATYGLGAYDLWISFNPSGIRINGVLAGAEPFGEPAACNIDNINGSLIIVGYHTMVPGPNGDVLIARLNLTALSAGNWIIDVQVNDLIDVEMKNINATAIPGVIQVSSTGTTPTPTPTATATMTPIPTATPTPLPTPTATPSATTTPIPTPSPTPTATSTPIPSPTPTTTKTPTATPILTATPTPAVTSTPLPTPTTVPSYVPTATSTQTPVQAVTPAPSPEMKPSPTASVTTAAATSAPSPAPAPEKEGISTGLLIAIAGIVIVIGGAAIYWFLLRKR